MSIDRLTDEERRNLEAVRRTLEAMIGGDSDPFFRTFAEHGTFRFTGPAGSRISEVYRGPEGAREVFELVGEAVEVGGMAVDTVIARQQVVVAIGSVQPTLRSSGETLDKDWAMVLEMSDGQITKAICYQDVSFLAEALEC